MDLATFAAFQVSFLPIQLILWYGLYSERKRMQSLLRFAVVKLQSSRR